MGYKSNSFRIYISIDSLAYIVSLLNFLPEKDYPVNSKTISKHTRKKKPGRGLIQKEVAKIIGALESSI